MTRIDDLYVETARDILENGYIEKDVENAHVRAKWEGENSAYAIYLPQKIFEYKEGEVPILNKRKIAWKSAIKEILWIYGDRSNDVGLLRDKYNVKYWDSWQLEDGTLGKAYGYQVNKEFISPETGETTNQIDRLIYLLRHDPLNRRIIMNLIDMDDMADMSLVPCAFLTMWTVTGDRLNMTLIQRSGDFVAAAGPGSINAFQYYALLRMVAQVTGYEAGNFVHFIQNLHIYDKHLDIVKEIAQADVSEAKAPSLEINPDIREFKDFKIEDFKLLDYSPDKRKYDIPVAI